MASTLKGFFSPSLVKRLAADLVHVAPGVPERAFVKQASTGLGALELLDRGRHIARALAEHLPPAYPEAVALLLRSLGPEHARDELLGVGERSQSRCSQGQHGRSQNSAHHSLPFRFAWADGACRQRQARASL